MDDTRCEAAVRRVARGPSLRSVGGLLLAVAALLGGTTGTAQAAHKHAPKASAQQPTPSQSGPDDYRGPAGEPWSDGQIHPYQVQGNVWLMGGEPNESNVVVQVGEQGALVVDAGVQSWAPKLLGAVKQLVAEHGGDQYIRTIIDTDVLMDHIGGNEVMRLGGQVISAANMTFDNPGRTAGATVLSHLNVLNRMVAGVPKELWPNVTKTADDYSFRFNGSAVLLNHPHSANTDGNFIVMFRSADVIATGDVVDERGYPIIDVARGGSIDGELVALNALMLQAVTETDSERGTYLVPGHGYVIDKADLAEYIETLTTIRNRVQYYKNMGDTLEQVLSIKPSWDYDERWGHTSQEWGAKQFIEAVYQTLPAKGPSFTMKGPLYLVPGDAAPAEGRYY